MVVAFPATEPSWALRAYLVLIGCAADRQTVTYGELATRIKRGGPNLLSEPLGTGLCHAMPVSVTEIDHEPDGEPHHESQPSADR